MPRHTLLSTAILAGVLAASASAQAQSQTVRVGVPSAAERDRRACEGVK